MENKRERYLDVLRIVATCAVVMLHTITGTTDIHYAEVAEARYPAYYMLIDWCSWAVPVFLMMSGYLFLNPKREVPVKKMYLKHCMRILIAIFLFGVPFSLIEQIAGYHGFIWPMIPNALLAAALNRNWAHMWYLYAILVLYAITPLLRLILPKIPKAVVYVFIAIVFVITGVIPFIDAAFSVPIWCLHFLPVNYFTYYLCGYCFAISERKATKGRVCLYGGLIVAVMAFEAVNRLVIIRSMGPGYDFPFTALLAMLIFAFAMNVAGIIRGQADDAVKTADAADSTAAGDTETGKGAKVLTFFADLCFGIYLVHPVFLNFFYKFLDVSLYDYPFVPGLLMFFGLTLAGSVVLTILMRLIPPMRKYVL